MPREERRSKSSDRAPVAEFELEGRGTDLEADAIWSTLERGGFARSEAVQAQVEELLPLGRGLIRPRALGRVLPIESIDSEDRQALPTPICDADYLCFSLCTAGKRIDERARALCEAGKLIDSMIVDAIAMTGLSIIGDRLGRAIFDWAKERGLSASRVFSPGAGASGWELENQSFIFAHLPDDPLGVVLTQHFLMQPSKSVSFVIGIGQRIKQAKHAVSCEGCDRFDCSYRHIPDSEMVRAETVQTIGCREGENYGVTNGGRDAFVLRTCG